MLLSASPSSWYLEVRLLLALEVTEMIADGADSKLSCVVSHGKSN